MLRKTLTILITFMLMSTITLGVVSASPNAQTSVRSASFQFLIAVLKDANNKVQLSDDINELLSDLFIEYLIAPVAGETVEEARQCLSVEGQSTFQLLVAVLKEASDAGVLSDTLNELLSDLFIEYLIVPITGETVEQARLRLSSQTTTVPVVHPSQILDWFDDPPDDAHSLAAKSIERIWDQYPDLGAGVATLAWVVDGITWDEQFVLEELSYIAAEDPELLRAVIKDARFHLLGLGTEPARRVAGYPWLADGMNSQELLAVIGISHIAKRNPSLAERVLSFAWLADGITVAEGKGLRALSLWDSHDPELVDRVAMYTWLEDGVTEPEVNTLLLLLSLEHHDGIETTKQVMDYLWLGDGVTQQEVDLLAQLVNFVEEDPEAARQIGLGTLVPYLLGLVSESGGEAAEYPWLADGLNSQELLAVIEIVRIAKQIPELASRLSGYSWLVDGLSQRELDGITGLASLARINFELAQQIVGMGLLDDPLRDRDLHAITTLGRLSETDDLALVIEQPWFTDGLTDEEIAFLAVTQRDQRTDAQYRDFLRTHFTRFATITLPLAGDVDV